VRFREEEIAEALVMGCVGQEVWRN